MIPDHTNNGLPEPMVFHSMPAVAPPSVNADSLLPHAYLLAKLAMVMPLFEEARDAITAIREDQSIRHGISKTLADRMDIAGTFSLDDWTRDFAQPTNSASPNGSAERTP